MASPRSPGLTKEEWEEEKAAIRQMYLAENKPCKDIRVYLEQKRKSKVTERQIKNRLNEWKFECKKTRAQHYLAMLSLANICATQGMEVSFDVPKRHTREEFGIKKVKKECDRIRKRCDKDHIPFTVHSLEVAHKILYEAGISWRTSVPRYDSLDTTPSGVPQTKDCSPLSGQDSSGGISPACGQGMVDQDAEKNWTCSPASEQTSPSVSGSCSSGIAGSQGTSPSMDEPVYTPGDSDDGADTPSGASISPVFPDSQVIPDSDVSHPGPWRLAVQCRKDVSMKSGGSSSSRAVLSRSIEAASPPFMLPPVQNNICGSERSCYRALYHPSPALDRWSKVSPSPSMRFKRETPKDFDFFESFGSIGIDLVAADSRSDPWNYSKGGHFPLNKPDGVHKMNACRWASPYYSQCFKDHVDEIALEKSKYLAMQTLKRSLKEDNQWIFPCLIWMVLILGSNLRMTELADFLSASCAIIDADPDMANSFTFAVPFQYTLAFATNNLHLISHWGGCLPRAHEQTRNIWGESHPNFLVICHFYAWHALRNQDYDRAIPLLRHCLPICERVMGSHSLVTINCLAIMSRAYEETNNFQWAMEYVQTALDRLNVHRPEMEKFRLTLLQRLASIKLRHTDDLQAAEKHLLDVLYGRGFLSGLDTKATWSTVHSLCEVFSKTGRVNQAGELLDYLTKRLNWERDRDWYVENKMEPPPPPWWWPSEAGELGGEACPGLFHYLRD